MANKLSQLTNLSSSFTVVCILLRFDPYDGQVAGRGSDEVGDGGTGRSGGGTLNHKVIGGYVSKHR